MLPRSCETRTIVFPRALNSWILPTAMLEGLVADGEHLVDQEDVRVDGDRDREPEAHVHARRVGLDRVVDEWLEPREGHDLVEARPDLRSGQPQQHPVDVDVLRPVNSGWNPAPSSMSAETRPRTVTWPVVGRGFLRGA